MSLLTRTLPASWYTSDSLHDFERQAVFLKAWYLLGPVTKFTKVEDVSYEMSGVKMTVKRLSGDANDIIVIRDSDTHELRSHLTRTGLLFSTISDDAPTFEAFFPGLEGLLERVDFTKLPYKRSIKYDGCFNWKTMVDGYQECLHCQYTHPSFSVLYPPTSYAVKNYHNFSQHIADPDKPDDGLFLYFFPNCTLNVYGGGMSSFRVCPSSDPNVTRMEFDYFNRCCENRVAFDTYTTECTPCCEEFRKYFEFVRQVAMEDFDLCERAQQNLRMGIYTEGILNPVKENGVSYYQQRVLDLVTAAYEDERSRSEHRFEAAVPVEAPGYGIVTLAGA